MDEIASKVAVERKPLTSQLDSWERSTAEKRQYYIQKATEDCMVVCDGIAPNDGKQLFEAMRSTNLEKPDPIADDLVRTLVHAYKKATKRSTKTQILSLYAYKYSISTLKNCTYHMGSYRRVKFTEHDATQEVWDPLVFLSRKFIIVCALT